MISSGGDWGLLNQGEFVRRGDRGGYAGAGGGQEGLQNKDPRAGRGELAEPTWLALDSGTNRRAGAGPTAYGPRVHIGRLLPSGTGAAGILRRQMR